MILKRILVITLVFLQSFLLKAQDHPIIDFFNGETFNDQILLSWNIIGGNNCNGITIYHSTDNLNYIEIGEIPGICGEIVDAEPYSFLHITPKANALNYYKLKLGSQGFTTPLELMFYKTGDKGFTFFPNPASEFFNVYVSKTNQNPRIEVFDSSGKKMISQYVTSGVLVQVDTFKLTKGVYIIRLLDGNEVVSNSQLVQL